MMTKNKRILFKELLLIITTLIWGFAFVFQDMGMEYVSPFTFNAMRSFVGAFFILLFAIVIRFVNKKKNLSLAPCSRKNLWLGGLICGVCLFGAMSTQQIGIMYEGAGKSGFLTALYILFVPIFGLLFKRKTSIKILFCLFFAAIGVYFINKDPSGFAWSKGSFFLLLCAMFYGMQIIAIDHYANLCDTFYLTALQFFICAILSSVMMFLLETPSVYQIAQAAIPILFVGILSSGVAFTFQTYAQKEVHPVVASLIMSLESVFAVIGAWLFLHETLSLTETIGCLIIFLSILLSQISFTKKSQT